MDDAELSRLKVESGQFTLAYHEQARLNRLWGRKPNGKPMPEPPVGLLFGEPIRVHDKVSKQTTPWYERR